MFVFLEACSSIFILFEMWACSFILLHGFLEGNFPQLMCEISVPDVFLLYLYA